MKRKGEKTGQEKCADKKKKEELQNFQHLNNFPIRRF